MNFFVNILWIFSYPYYKSKIILFSTAHSLCGMTLLCLMLQLHGVIYRPDSFVLMLHYCANLKAIRYESMSLNRIVADKLNCVIVA